MLEHFGSCYTLLVCLFKNCSILIGPNSPLPSSGMYQKEIQSAFHGLIYDDVQNSAHK